MKCKYCGNPIEEKANFCTACGKPVDGKENVNIVQDVDQKDNVTSEGTGRKLYYDTNSSKEEIGGNIVGNNYSSSKGGGLLIFIAIFFIVVFLGTFVSSLVLLGSFNNKKVIELGTDEITTIYGAFDKGRKICSYSVSSSGAEEKVELRYCDSQLVRADYDKYADYLVENEGFEELNDSGKKKVRKYSKDYSYEIVVILDSNSSTIIYDKRDFSDDYENYDIGD